MLATQEMENKVQQTNKLIVGLGQTGLSCLRYFAARNENTIAFDTRKNPPQLKQIQSEFPDLKIYTQTIDENVLENVDEIIVSPGVSLELPILIKGKNLGKRIIGDMGIFAELAPAPIIAITGSNGKSTTTSLVYEILKSANKKVLMGGNIGIPVLELLLMPAPDYYVLELSSFQLETTRNLSAKIAVILNISEDHMDRYESVEHYATSKLAVYENADVGLVNLDDIWCKENVVVNNNAIGFTMSLPGEKQFGICSANNEKWICFGTELICKASDILMPGEHQQLNALVAVSIAKLLEIDSETICEVLKSFKGLEHRTQLVAEINDVQYINDSKGTNVGATIAALNGIKSPIILIAGGEGKGADFSPLASAIKDNVKQLILIGADASKMEKQFAGLVPIIRAINLTAAVKQAQSCAGKGDCVLLSPACASFDMFDNYQHRGQVFMTAVQELANHGK